MTEIKENNNQVQTPNQEIEQPKKTKKQILLDMLKSENGATKKQMMEATGWQNHSIRGMLSGAFKKKMNLNITSQKNKDDDLVYRIIEDNKEDSAT